MCFSSNSGVGNVPKTKASFPNRPPALFSFLLFLLFFFFSSSLLLPTSSDSVATVDGVTLSVRGRNQNPTTYNAVGRQWFQPAHTHTHSHLSLSIYLAKYHRRDGRELQEPQLKRARSRSSKQLVVVVKSFFISITNSLAFLRAAAAAAAAINFCWAPSERDASGVSSCGNRRLLVCPIER